MDPWTETLQRAAELAARGELAQAAELHALRAQWQRQHGQLREAITSYERALALCAEQPDVWVNLARARREAGRLEAALTAFRRAAALEPRASTSCLLSNALREAGRHTEALEAARAALALDPECSEAYLNEGAALHTQGDVASAVCSYFVATLHESTRERALHDLRSALGRPLPAEPGVAIVQRLLAAPDAPTLLELGQFLARQQRYAGACVCLERALSLQPSAAGLLALGVSAWQGGWHARAEAAVLRALELAPADARGYRLLGSWYGDGPLRPGERCFAQFARCPDDPPALAKLARAAQRLGRPLLALALYRRLAQLRPEVVESHVYVGAALTELGEWREAVLAFERALALDPERWDVCSSLLSASHLAPELSAEQLFERHRDFGERLAASVRAEPLQQTLAAQRARQTLDVAAAEPRPLRVGYVSPDLCAHPISYFLEPVLREHDRSAFEPICYSDVKRPDAVTARLAQLAQLVPVHGLSHDELCARILADGIDVLVDLAGHTAHNRLPVFARRPSPLQVSWLGYFDTTGLAAIDYRIADVWSVPHGAERYFVERVLRLPRTASCYQPPALAAAAPEPARAGPIRFGCFNDPAKIGREVCKLYARLLHGVPQSELWLKYRSFHEPELCERYLRWFAEEGIAPERIRFAGSSAVTELLAALGQLDVALDPFPHSGETTALHSLWRGVPLVTLEGPTPVQRLGSRVLHVAGLHEWVASDQEQYLNIAHELASDRARLAALRRQLPQRLAASPLLDQRGFTRELEAAFRSMWGEKHAPAGPP